MKTAMLVLLAVAGTLLLLRRPISEEVKHPKVENQRTNSGNASPFGLGAIEVTDEQLAPYRCQPGNMPEPVVNETYAITPVYSTTISQAESSKLNTNSSVATPR